MCVAKAPVKKHFVEYCIIYRSYYLCCMETANQYLQNQPTILLGWITFLLFHVKIRDFKRDIDRICRVIITLPRQTFTTRKHHTDTHTHTSSYNFYTQLPASNYLVTFIGTVRDNKMDESKDMDRSPCRYFKDQGYCISISCCTSWINSTCHVDYLVMSRVKIVWIERNLVSGKK